MKTAIVIIPYPAPEKQTSEREAWSNLSSESDKPSARSEGVARLDERIWQIDLDNGLPFFVWLVHQCVVQKLDYKVAFMDEPPKWIEPKT